MVGCSCLPTRGTWWATAAIRRIWRGTSRRFLGPRQDREAAVHEKKRETRGREYAKKEEKREQEKKDRQEDWKEYRRLDGGFGGKGRDRWREGSKQKAEKKAEKEAQSGSWEGWIKMRNRSGVDDGW